MAVGHNICGHLLSALLCLDGVFASGGQRCWMTKTTNIFSDEVETAFSCPQPGDPDHFTNCCGPSWQRKCCAPSKFNHGPIGGGSVISFFGIVTGVVILIVCLVLICCCCTPCCLLAKQRRRRGLVTYLLLHEIIVHIHLYLILRYCVHLLHPLLVWCQACLLPPNHCITRQALHHQATLVSLHLTLVRLKPATFLRFLSTKPNPQLTMSMLCDRGRTWALAQVLQFQRVSLSKESSWCHISIRNHIVLALSVLVYIVVLHVPVIV